MIDSSVFSEPQEAVEIYKRFSHLSGLYGLPFELKQRSDGDVLIIRVNHPTDRLFALLTEAEAEVEQGKLFPTRATLEAQGLDDRLHRPETELYLKVLSESLAVTRDSFRRDFFERYIPSVFGAEEQVLSEANHIIFGRRGSGKSSLMLFALMKREAANQANVWLDLQVYQGRSEPQVISDVLWDLLNQLPTLPSHSTMVEDVGKKLRALSTQHEQPDIAEIRRLLPDVRRALSAIAREGTAIFVYLDDLHVLPLEIQPQLLGILNSIARGSGMYLKVSSIESFTRTWDAATREGLEVTHDVQVLKLDYNLTKPNKARQHIESILDAHAIYSGLRSARYLCSEAAVLERLVWAAAGVPRDALNIFSQAITGAIMDDRPHVTVTDINTASSEAVNDKLRDVQLDGSGYYEDAKALLERIRRTCVQEKRSNAFLVRVQNEDPIYEGVRRLIDLRLLHVIHEGITVQRAGEKYVALILDYGFYVGLRASKNIDLFKPEKGKGQYEKLRSLPIVRAT